MGYVSYTEDIEEIRNEREHFRKGFAAIIAKARSSTSIGDLKRAELDIRAQQETLTTFLQRLEQRVLAVFDAAEKRLKDPCDRHLEQTAAMVLPSVVIKGGMGGRRLARWLRRSIDGESGANASSDSSARRTAFR